MAVTERSRRLRYDNIAAGSATGHERTIAGESVTPIEMYGGGMRTSTSTGDVWHTNIAAGVSTSEQALSAAAGGEQNENIVAKATTGTLERLTV